MTLSKIIFWHIAIDFIGSVFFDIQIIEVNHIQKHVWLIYVCHSELGSLNFS